MSLTCLKESLITECINGDPSQGCPHVLFSNDFKLNRLVEKIVECSIYFTQPRLMLPLYISMVLVLFLTLPYCPMVSDAEYVVCPTRTILHLLYTLWHAREGWPRHISSVDSLFLSLLIGSNQWKQQETWGQGICFHTSPHLYDLLLQKDSFTKGPQPKPLLPLGSYNSSPWVPAPNHLPLGPRSDNSSLLSLDPSFFHKPAHTFQKKSLY